MLFAILGLASWLRWHDIGAQSFWLDEIYSVESAVGRGFAHRLLPANTLIDRPSSYTDTNNLAPWAGVWRNASQTEVGDIHPPLGYLAVRAWGQLFGFGEASLRSLSALASVLGILLLFLIARELHGEKIALWAGLLMALSATQITFAQEAKHYALLQLFALAAALPLVRIDKRGPTIWRAVCLTVMLLAIMLTHYFGIGAIAAMLAYALVRLRGKTLVTTVTCFTLSACLFAALWLPSVLRQAHVKTQEMEFFDEKDPHFLARWTEHLIENPYRQIGQPLPSMTGVSYALSIVYVLPLWFLIFAKRRDLLFWILWFDYVIGAVAAVDIANHTWRLHLPRYTLLAGPAMFALLAAMTARMRPLLRHGVPACIAIAFVPFIPTGWHTHPQQNKAVAEQVVAWTQPHGVAIFGGQDAARAYQRYLVILHYAHHLPGAAVILTDPPSPLLIRTLQGKGPLVYVDERLLDVKSVFPTAKVTNTRFLPGTVIIYQFTLPNDQPASLPSAQPQTGPTR